MSLKRNLLMFAAYIAALVFMSLPFAQIEAKGPSSSFAEVARSADMIR